MKRAIGVLLFSLVTVASIIAAPFASAGTFGPVYQYTALQPSTLHNTGGAGNLDLSINGVVYQNRDVWLQAQENGATMWGGPNVPKAQKLWRYCWYVVNPQTATATARLDVLWDGVVLTTADVNFNAFAHSDSNPYHTSVVCATALSPSQASQVQIRFKLLAQAAGNFVGVYKTTIQETTSADDPATPTPEVVQ